MDGDRVTKDDQEIANGVETQTSGERNNSSAHEVQAPNKKPPFQPIDDTSLHPQLDLPDERWLSVLSASCIFPPEIFDGVMYNLIKNPNITSNHLFRADIFYDSDLDRLNHSGELDSGLAQHLKPECRPIPAEWPNFTRTRTIVRQLIPRNAQLDRPLLQTCHFFSRDHEQGDAPRTDTLILYIPHVTDPSEIPFYHPSVSRLAFLHTYTALPPCSPSPSPSLQPEPEPTDESPHGTGTLTILYLPFSPSALSPKLTRTALALLSTIHKHGHGQLAGYVKRVHHDRVIPQRRYQETYARLKARHGRALIAAWAEVTDPGKHVFEDLGIAAFLIELWRGMYADFPLGSTLDGKGERERGEGSAKPNWRGFVDVGCGNGVLVHILLSEGCGPGWGFDARERKSWGALGEDGSTAGKLERRVLIPEVLGEAWQEGGAGAGRTGGGDGDFWHDGVFGDGGQFIVSNHADQLTLWTPLLAYLNGSGFIAIPCCSHDFAGARFRAPVGLRGKDQTAETERGADEGEQSGDGGRRKHIAESGSLARTPAKGKGLSAYASLCAYVSAVADDVGFCTETETLRIPSTRNVCIVGRRWKDGSDPGMADRNVEERKAKVIEIIEREMKRSSTSIAEEWIQRVEGLMKKPGSGH